MSAVRLTVRRLAAYGVDVLVLAIVLVPFDLLVGAVAGADITTGTGVWLRSLLTISVPAWAYFILTDHLAGGRSLGKRLLRLRTRGSDGSAPGWKAWVAMLSYALMGVYVVVALLNGGRRSLPDLVAATYVEPTEGH